MGARHPLIVSVAAAWALAMPAVGAGEDRSSPADQARRLVERVPAPERTDELDVWVRSVVGPALEGADSPPGAVPDFSLPAPAVKPPSAEVLIFTSLAVPVASWHAAARDAARIGATLVLRGVVKASLPATARRIRARLGGADAGVAIDPRLFRLFGITRVPAVVVVPGGVPPCRSRGCAEDAPPPFDRVSGNLSLAAALEAVTAEGEAGRSAARRYLATLRGTTP